MESVKRLICMLLAEKIICVDPGHEMTSQRVQEPISPHSNATKEAFVGGASGRNQTEEQLNLAVGLRLVQKTTVLCNVPI